MKTSPLASWNVEKQSDKIQKCITGPQGLPESSTYSENKPTRTATWAPDAAINGDMTPKK